MDRTERFHIIHTLLGSRQSVTFDELLERLEVSRATLKRDLQYLRDRLNAPIVWDPELRGYRFESARGAGTPYELPGLWFSAGEIHALLTMQELLAGLDAGGLLGPHIEPLMARLTTLLDSGRQSAQEVRKRVKLIALGTRKTSLEHFSSVGAALLARQRLRIVFFTKGSGAQSEREVSPQRLVHYRGNWYLDAWCHLRDGLRSFAVDGIRAAEILPAPAVEVPAERLDRELGDGYGIFSGAATQWAHLKFTPERARWVALEEWHPRQRTSVLDDGSYLIELPYSDDRELIMDVLRHVPEVEVLGPDELREKVAARLRAGLARHA
ncbi:MAG: WYL domain-containing protein [Pseudomonadota bacterium]